jgi:hypothetical protein
MPRGGRRPGAGRKPKSPHLRAIDGGADHRSPAPSVSTATATIEPFDPPATLKGKALGIWHELAPHAYAARTLTPAMTVAFVMLCRNVALERSLATRRLTKGSADHRGMIQRVEAALLRFNVAPCGKAIYEPEAAAAAPTNPLTRFTLRRRA